MVVGRREGEEGKEEMVRRERVREREKGRTHITNDAIAPERALDDEVLAVEAGEGGGVSWLC